MQNHKKCRARAIKLCEQISYRIYQRSTIDCKEAGLVKFKRDLVRLEKASDNFRQKVKFYSSPE